MDDRRPPVELADGSVIVPGDVAGDLIAAVVRDLRNRARRDGLSVSARTVAVLTALQHAAVRHEERQAAPTATSEVGSVPPPSLTVWITAREAASAMGCSEEWVRALCRSGAVMGRRAGTTKTAPWLIDTASLDRYRYGQERTECPEPTSRSLR